MIGVDGVLVEKSFTLVERVREEESMEQVSAFWE
jgi:hypothetical protein